MFTFPDDRNDVNYKNIVERMLKAFEEQCFNMSLKLHFLHSHVVYSPKTRGPITRSRMKGLTKISKTPKEDIKENEIPIRTGAIIVFMCLDV